MQTNALALEHASVLLGLRACRFWLGLGIALRLVFCADCTAHFGRSTSPHRWPQTPIPTAPLPLLRHCSIPSQTRMPKQRSSKMLAFRALLTFGYTPYHLPPMVCQVLDASQTDDAHTGGLALWLFFRRQLLQAIEHSHMSCSHIRKVCGWSHSRTICETS